MRSKSRRRHRGHDLTGVRLHRPTNGQENLDRWTAALIRPWSRRPRRYGQRGRLPAKGIHHARRTCAPSLAGSVRRCGIHVAAVVVHARAVGIVQEDASTPRRRTCCGSRAPEGHRELAMLHDQRWIFFSRASPSTRCSAGLHPPDRTRRCASEVDRQLPSATPLKINEPLLATPGANGHKRSRRNAAAAMRMSFVVFAYSY